MLAGVVCSHDPIRRAAAKLAQPAAAMSGAAKVRRIRLHDARHSCASLMHAQGVPIAVISAWLGHADAAFTMRTYVHSQDDALKIAAATLQRIVTTQ